MSLQCLKPRQDCLLALAAAIGLFFLGCRQAERTDLPNIVLVVVDTLRADGLSVYGNSRPTSPNLDRLAEDSQVFTQSYSVGANTSVGMASLMTGRFPFYSEEAAPCTGKNGACAERWDERTWFGLQRFNEPDEIGISESLTTLAEALQSAGYFTAGFVTNAHLKRRYHFDQGFAVYREIFRDEYPNYGLGEVVSAAAIEILTPLPKQPFFLFLHYMDPHAPYLPAPEYKDLVGPLENNGLSDADLFKNWSVDFRSLKGNDNAADIIEHARGLYDAEVRYTDDQIGKVIDALKAMDLYDDTLIVVTADHGEEFYEHGRMGHTGQLFDEHIRVPLLIKVPGQEGKRHTQLVRNFDIMPTLLDYVGATLPDGSFDAETLRGIIENYPDLEPRFVYSSFPFLRVRRMYRDRHYKLIYHPEKPEKSLLFDLRKDPEEKVNRYHTEPEVAADLVRKLDYLSARLRQEGIQRKSSDELEPDPETRSQLEAVGYLQPLPGSASEVRASGLRDEGPDE